MSEERNSILQLLILSTIAEEGHTAGEVIDLLSNSFGDQWIPRRGSVYPAIKQLENKGYLKKNDERPMRIRLSSEGLERFPNLIIDFLDYITKFFEFIDIFQENLAEMSTIDPNLRKKFLENLLQLLKAKVDSFETSLIESELGKSSWKDVTVK